MQAVVLEGYGLPQNMSLPYQQSASINTHSIHLRDMNSTLHSFQTTPSNSIHPFAPQACTSVQAVVIEGYGLPLNMSLPYLQSVSINITVRDTTNVSVVVPSMTTVRTLWCVCSCVCVCVCVLYVCVRMCVCVHDACGRRADPFHRAQTGADSTTKP